MKHIIDLEYYVNEYGEESLIDCLYEHACHLGIDQLVLAIEQLWQSQADTLTTETEEYYEAQRQSIKEQFSDD